MAKPTILVDNEKIKVTEWFFDIGDSTGQHIHEYDYVVVPMLDGELKIIDKDKTKIVLDLGSGTKVNILRTAIQQLNKKDTE